MSRESKPGGTVRGVVRGGRVELDAPLVVPDGTVVAVRPCGHQLAPVQLEPDGLTAEQVRWLEEDLAWLRARAERQAARPAPKAA